MWAVKKGLETLMWDDSDCHVLLQIDNITAVAYVNKMGGTKSHNCRVVARQIWQWALSRGIWLSAEHIPGESNVEADQGHFQMLQTFATFANVS